MQCVGVGLDLKRPPQIAGGAAFATVQALQLDTAQTDVDILVQCDWDRFEDTFFTLRSSPRLVVTSTNVDAFKWLLDAITRKNILSRTTDRGRLELEYVAPSDANRTITKHDILCMPAEYSIDGVELKLDIEQRFMLWLKTTAEGKMQYLRDLAVARRRFALA